MRLLEIYTFELCEFMDTEEIPKYVITSHLWVRGTETTKKDVEKGRNRESQGFQKLLRFVEWTKIAYPDIRYLWMDTCCIDNRHLPELSEAVNSMYVWYANAAVCLAFLADVDGDDSSLVTTSRWFKRGWTLQELIAPGKVIFLSARWNVIGHKISDREVDTDSVFTSFPRAHSLHEEIASVTGIPQDVLKDPGRIENYSVATRCSWMDGRATTKKEDIVYGLMGLVDAPMGVNYGEGVARARMRLQECLQLTQRVASSQQQDIDVLSGARQEEPSALIDGHADSTTIANARPMPSSAIHRDSASFPSNRVLNASYTPASDAAAPKESKYRALYAFTSQEKNELSIRPNEVITILQKEDSLGWWYGRRLDGSESGWLPAAYMKPMVKPVAATAAAGATTTKQPDLANRNRSYSPTRLLRARTGTSDGLTVKPMPSNDPYTQNMTRSHTPAFSASSLIARIAKHRKDDPLPLDPDESTYEAFPRVTKRLPK